LQTLNGLDQVQAGGDAGPAPAAARSIEVRGLHKTYETRRGPVEAVRGVSFDVRNGEFVSLVGPSGCGKSTILHITAGLIDYEAGDVQVAGTNAEAGRRDVGIMLQKPVLLPWRTVAANVLMPAEIFGLDKASSKARASELLGLMGLDGFEEKHPWELSGGMQQRASLARLLLPDPAILLMDEPFAALDEFTRERLNGELARLHERLGRSVLYVTHNIPEAVFLSDRVVVLKARPGEVLEIVDVDLPRPRSLELISDPRTAELSARIRELLGATRDELTEPGPNEEVQDG
jgi:NitT/TauT family transport system ATP-binding protein